MVLAVDVGNTNITVGVFDGDDMLFKVKLETVRSKTEDEYASVIYAILTIRGIKTEKIEGAVISSVVPGLNPVIKKALKIISNSEVLLVGPGVKTGLPIKCDVPSSVGADLICASVGAVNNHQLPCLIVDMGTATKFILIDGKGAFTGVSIAPGVNISMEALAKNTSQLPEVSLESPRAVIGKNTVESIKSGVVYGGASMVDGMIKRIEEEAKTTLNIIGTGELSGYILPFCTSNITMDDDLLLKGLNIIYKKNTCEKQA